MTIGVLAIALGANAEEATDKATPREQALRRARTSLSAQGFVCAHRHSWSDGAVELWTLPDHQQELHALRSDAGSACSVGPLWYRGAFGNEALRRLLEDTSAGWQLDESQLRGNFVAFVETAGGRWVFNDALGFVRIHRSADSAFYCTSWLATRAWTGTTEIDEAATVEYVLVGASHSNATPARNVARVALGHGVDLRTQREFARFPDGLVDTARPKFASFDEALASIDAQLHVAFSEIAGSFPGRTSAALSGGFDSRLIVASLLAEGERPSLFVYGADDFPDVRIARTIARTESIGLRVVDKAARNATLPECNLADLVSNALFFDGLPTDGIDDRGVDRATRLEQHEGGRIALNGGGGEIFRNFFYLPDRPYRPLDIVRTFYRVFDRGVFRIPGALTAFEERLAKSILRSVGSSDDESVLRATMSRARVELVYPFFRCHHWMGLNNGIAIRCGYFSTPLVDLELVRLAAMLPLAWKNAGAFESALITARHGGIASHPSGYGFRFVDGPDSRMRRKEWLTRLRPPGLRPAIGALRRRVHNDRVPAAHVRRWRGALSGEWRIDSLLDVERLPNDGAFDRALSVEVVARELAP